MAVDPSRARQILESLRQGFIDQVPQRLAAIEQCWIDFSLADDPKPVMHELMRLAHSLRGSAKTFGLMALGDAAGRLEAELAPWVAEECLPDAAARALLDGHVAALHTTSLEVRDRVRETLPEAAQADRGKAPLVYLLEDEPVQAALLTSQLEHYGYRAVAFPQPKPLLERFEKERPDVCILDIIVGAAADAGIKLGQQLHRNDPTQPVIYASVRDDIEARLGAVRAGGKAYLTKPIDIGRMIELVEQVTGRAVNEPYRILIVEDDLSLAGYYRALLQDAGMEATVVADPLQVLQAVADFSPDLVLLDVYMPQCTGAELAHVIRQHDALGGLPIVFLSSEVDPDVQYAVLRSGGDDFLTKPVNPMALVRRVTMRAQRARQVRSLMTRDGLTGLLNHGRIKELLISELARARRANAPLAVALLDLDHFKTINDRYGYRAGDRVLRSLARLLRDRLRGSDLAGRFGGDEFLVVLPDCNRESAVSLLEDVRGRFAAIVQAGESSELTFSATFSAGLATFPFAAQAEEMLMDAETALSEAKQHGRNCIR